MIKFPYSINRNPESSNLEADPKPKLDVVIDFIRHGKTDYSAQTRILKDIETETRPLSHHNFRDAIRNRRDEKELLPEGVEDIKDSARQIAEVVDPNNEVIFIVASPAPRTWESAQVFIQELQKISPQIQILNPQNIQEAWQLKTVALKAPFKQDQKLEADGETTNPNTTSIVDWYKNPENKKVSFDALEHDFYNFLRHATNIKQYLTSETLSKVQNKKLRIVCFTHTELPYRFVKYSFQLNDHTEADLTHGQILEITPKNLLLAQGKTNLKIKIYPKADKPAKETQIDLSFISTKEVE